MDLPKDREEDTIMIKNSSKVEKRPDPGSMSQGILVTSWVKHTGRTTISGYPIHNKADMA